MKIITFLFFIFLSLIFAPNANAIYDPLSRPNNIFGVHILFPDEIYQAADLINSNNGDWGYVTIPIQSIDLDLEKWQKFMTEAKKLHVIPIVRLATTNDYFNTSVWEKPKYQDILDFTNFLNSLDWPSKNRYIVVYNEVNRGDEWGGSINPLEYAQILDYAVEVFKSKNQDFFVISAGLDNAAPNKAGQYMDQYSFMRQMNYAVSDIFSKIDGLASHSYPNPGFSQPPEVTSSKSIHSFKFESELAKSLGGKDLPVFVTETGWSENEVSQSQIASYLKQAFNNVWSNKNVVAVTPFLLRAGMGPFTQFSLISENGEVNQKYRAIASIEKIKGEPLEMRRNSTKVKKAKFFVKDFSQNLSKEKAIEKAATAGIFLKWLLKI